MKKVIWLFGQPGAGKKTLIKNISNNLNDTRKIFDMENKKISYIDIPFDRNKLIYDSIDIYRRKDNIHESVSNFMNDDNDILILSGQTIDYNDKENDNIEYICSRFPNIEKEIIFLNPSDSNVLYERLKETDWFKSNYKVNLGKYPKIWLDFAIDHTRKYLFNYEKMGYKVYEVDTLDGYTIKDAENSKKI